MKTSQNKNEAIVSVGNWKYYPQFGRFKHDKEEEFFINNRLNKVLMILIEKQGEIAKREEIIESVWNEVQVNEENLTKGIFDLRKLFREKEINELEIKTIRNVGYRLNIRNHENQISSVDKPVMKMVIKWTIYIFMFMFFLILFIRAFRYEN